MTLTSDQSILPISKLDWSWVSYTSSANYPLVAKMALPMKSLDWFAALLFFLSRGQRAFLSRRNLPSSVGRLATGREQSNMKKTLITPQPSSPLINWIRNMKETHTILTRVKTSLLLHLLKAAITMITTCRTKILMTNLKKTLFSSTRSWARFPERMWDQGWCE